MGIGLVRGLALGVAAAFAVGGNGFIVVEARAMAATLQATPSQDLNRTIQRAIRADGPFFTPAEQAVINSKCGYAPGEWDGYDVYINDDSLRCKNGKRVDDPEMRALLEVAQPRIGRRVERVMARADVQAAIQRVSEDATRRALASIDHAKIAARAAREALEETRWEMRRAR
jgi:hypothetical protein